MWNMWACKIAPYYFPKIHIQTIKPFTIIHSDLWGPSRIPNRTHTKWLVTFIDDHTQVCRTYLLREKTDVRSTFINFRQMIQTQFQTQIQVYTLIIVPNTSMPLYEIIYKNLKSSTRVHASTLPNKMELPSEKIHTWGCQNLNVHLKYAKKFLGRCYLNFNLSYQPHAKSHSVLQFTYSKASRFISRFSSKPKHIPQGIWLYCLSSRPLP